MTGESFVGKEKVTRDKLCMGKRKRQKTSCAMGKKKMTRDKLCMEAKRK